MMQFFTNSLLLAAIAASANALTIGVKQCSRSEDVQQALDDVDSNARFDEQEVCELSKKEVKKIIGCIEDSVEDEDLPSPNQCINIGLGKDDQDSKDSEDKDSEDKDSKDEESEDKDSKDEDSEDKDSKDEDDSSQESNKEEPLHSELFSAFPITVKKLEKLPADLTKAIGSVDIDAVPVNVEDLDCSLMIERFQALEDNLGLYAGHNCEGYQLHLLLKIIDKEYNERLAVTDTHIMEDYYCYATEDEEIGCRYFINAGADQAFGVILAESWSGSYDKELRWVPVDDFHYYQGHRN